MARDDRRREVTVRLTALGAEVAPDGLAAVVAAFRAASEVRAGLVLPFDRPATVEDIGLDPALTTTGVLWTDDAECRWRLEGDLAVVTVIADGPTGDELTEVGGLEIERHVAIVEDSEGPVVWVRAPFALNGGEHRFIERVYRTAAGPVHRRLHVVVERAD
jgi:hypothetical protein